MARERGREIGVLRNESEIQTTKERREEKMIHETEKKLITQPLGGKILRNSPLQGGKRRKITYERPQGNEGRTVPAHLRGRRSSKKSLKKNHQGENRGGLVGMGLWGGGVGGGGVGKGGGVGGGRVWGVGVFLGGVGSVGGGGNRGGFCG